MFSSNAVTESQFANVAQLTKNSTTNLKFVSDVPFDQYVKDMAVNHTQINHTRKTNVSLKYLISFV